MLELAVISLCVVSGASLVFWLFAIARILRSLLSVPTARAGLGLGEPEGGWPCVCVVVPAHNEEGCIGGVARSLLEQDYPRLRVVFALDRCTDGTERVVREAVGGDERFEVVGIESCPEEWAGKTHAAHRGVVDSEGGRGAEALLFIDADTTLDPACVRATVALLRGRGLGMLSLLSTLSTETWWERVIQPVASFELLRHFPLEDVNDPRNKRAFANGQFMLFEREAYERVGGHEAVKDALLEDVAFAKRLIRPRFHTAQGLLLADGMHRCRMYESLEAFRRGWKRIFTESAGRRPDRLRRWAWQLVGMQVVMPCASVVTIGLGVAAFSAMGDVGLGASALGLGASSLLTWLLANVGLMRVQRAPWWSGAAGWYGAARVAGLLREAARDLERGRGIEWAGRTYVRTAGEG